MGKTVLAVTLVGQDLLLGGSHCKGVKKRVAKDFPEDSFNPVYFCLGKGETIYLITGIHLRIDLAI